MVIPDNQYYSIYLNLNLYLPSDVLFTCSKYWRSKLALQLNGAKVNQSPHKWALRTYLFSCYKTYFPNTYSPLNTTSNRWFTSTTVLCITPPGTAQVPSQIGFLIWGEGVTCHGWKLPDSESKQPKLSSLTWPRQICVPRGVKQIICKTSVKPHTSIIHTVLRFTKQ